MGADTKMGRSEVSGRLSVATTVEGGGFQAPQIPESAPFTPEQRAWLNGFLAGCFSTGATVHSEPETGSLSSVAPVTILYGTQTGGAKMLARQTGKKLKSIGFVPEVIDIGELKTGRLAEASNVLLLTSTYGEGDPPDTVKDFHAWLHSDKAPRLDHINFSVLALGDTNYEAFCKCGKDFDLRFEELGARRIYDRIDCDVDYEEPYEQWIGGVIPALEALSGSETDRTHLIGNGRGKPEEMEAEPKYSKHTPFPAKLLRNLNLNLEGSGKETRHVELSLQDSGLEYEVGDALGVFPTNCPLLVEDLLRAMNFDGEETVRIHTGDDTTLRAALIRNYEIRLITRPVLQRLAPLINDPEINRLLNPDARKAFNEFVYGRELIDLMLQFPGCISNPLDLLGVLKKMAPRLYSISSSPKAHPGEVHLTVAAVRYRSHERNRNGVASTYLAERVGDQPVPVFVHKNPNFGLPEDPNADLIMVGPGTGIAPFRAFMEERVSMGASGRSWLFFGDQHERTDFLYRDEILQWKESGALNELDTAFSRDFEMKIYVQHRMKQRSQELYQWLERGAFFYVCGDASRMAKDVDQALHEIVGEEGGMNEQQAADYVKTLKKQKRYQRDVY